LGTAAAGMRRMGPHFPDAIKISRNAWNYFEIFIA
jgi:hypothetical protein